jgi:hypothetical protein
MMLARLFWGGVLLAVAAGPANAQDPAFAKSLADLEKAFPAPTPAEMAAPALETLQATARADKSCVPTGVVMKPAMSASATLVVTNWIGSKQVSNGWTAYGRPQGCSAKVPTRFVVLRLPTGELIARIVNIGESLTPPSMMSDSAIVLAATLAVGAIKKAHPGCTGIEGLRMEESRVASRSPDLGPDFRGQRYRGSWEEVWTFSQCGHRAEIPISFVNDGQGGARFSADERRAKPLD